MESEDQTLLTIWWFIWKSRKHSKISEESWETIYILIDDPSRSRHVSLAQIFAYIFDASFFSFGFLNHWAEKLVLFKFI